MILLYFIFFFLMSRLPPISTLFPYTTLFRSLPLSWYWAPARTGPYFPTYFNDESRRQHREPPPRSEEHTSELQSQSNLVCRLLLEKKKNNVLNSNSSKNVLT